MTIKHLPYPDTPVTKPTMKPDRFLTVGIDRDTYPKNLPWIRMRGQWLAQAGFVPRTRIHIRVGIDRLVLTAIREKPEPREVLRKLLEANGLQPEDLHAIASHALVNDILAGRRVISKRLAGLLAERFDVDVDAFI